MSSDVSGRNDPTGSNPEAVLEFLSQHRQNAERGTRTNRRTRRRGRKTALLVIVAAIALAGAGILVWRTVASSGATGRAHVTALGKSSARTRTSTGASRTTTAPRNAAQGKTQKTALHTPPAAAPWNRGLQYSGHPTRRHLPNFYYRWLRGRSSCARFATYGCWKVKVVTRHGCPHGLMMVVDETKGGADVGVTWAFSRPLAARTSTIVEVDADQSDVSSRVDSMLCKS